MSAYNTVGYEVRFNGSITSGTLVTLPLNLGLFFGGPAFIECTYQTTITGQFQILGANGMIVDFADTAEGHAQPSSSFSAIYKLCAFPTAPYSLQFLPRVTTAGATIVVRAIPNY